MLFGKKLCSISQDEKFIRELWEQMKPQLEKIAEDRQPKGCLIAVTGEKPFGFDDTMYRIMQSEAIIYERIGLNENFYMALWDKTGISHAGNTLRYEKLSDKFLEIGIDSNNNVSFSLKELPEYKKAILRERLIFCIW